MQILEDENIGISSRRNTSDVLIQTEIDCRMNRHHAIGFDRIHPLTEDDSEKMIGNAEIPMKGGTGGIACQHHPIRQYAIFHNGPEKISQIRPEGALSEHHMQAQPEPVQNLPGTDALMAGFYPKPGKPIDFPIFRPCRMTVDPLSECPRLSNHLDDPAIPGQKILPSRNLPERGRSRVSEKPLHVLHGKELFFPFQRGLRDRPAKPEEFDGHGHEGVHEGFEPFRTHQRKKDQIVTE